VLDVGFGDEEVDTIDGDRLAVFEDLLAEFLGEPLHFGRHGDHLEAIQPLPDGEVVEQVVLHASLHDSLMLTHAHDQNSNS